MFHTPGRSSPRSPLLSPPQPGARASRLTRHRFRLILVLAALATGCNDRGFRVPTQPEVVPAADSPRAAMRVVEWCWNQRRLDVYSGVVSADFVFQFGALDPYGNAYRDHPWTREDELISLDHLFHGGGDKQAASSIALALDRNFIVASDPRPGKNPRWHKRIRSSHFLSVLTADQYRMDVTGFTSFYLVRGDSAVVPREALDTGYVPDSTRWFLERWEDESATPGGRAFPSKNVTLGMVKVLYR